jgi:hypothetical protein
MAWKKKKEEVTAGHGAPAATRQRKRKNLAAKLGKKRRKK